MTMAERFRKLATDYRDIDLGGLGGDQRLQVCKALYDIADNLEAVALAVAELRATPIEGPRKKVVPSGVR